MNIEDRVAILEEEISVLKTSYNDSLKTYEDERKVSHIANNIDEFIHLSKVAIAGSNRIERALREIKSTYTVAKNFEELYEMEVKAKAILDALKINTDYDEDDEDDDI